MKYTRTHPYTQREREREIYITHLQNQVCIFSERILIFVLFMFYLCMLLKSYCILSAQSI